NKCLVDGDARQPGGEGRFPFEFVQVDEGFLESLLDNVFCVLRDACVAQRERENPWLVSLDKRFKCQFLTTLGGSDKRFLLWRITEGSELRFRFAAVFRQAGSHGAALLIGFKWHTVFKRSEEHTSELQSRGHLVC